jgi:hypothetical protein
MPPIPAKSDPKVNGMSGHLVEQRRVGGQEAPGHRREVGVQT